MRQACDGGPFAGTPGPRGTRVVAIANGDATSGQPSTAVAIARLIVDPVAVPGPASPALPGAGLLGLAAAARRLRLS